MTSRITMQSRNLIASANQFICDQMTIDDINITIISIHLESHKSGVAESAGAGVPEVCAESVLRHSQFSQKAGDILGLD